MVTNKEWKQAVAILKEPSKMGQTLLEEVLKAAGLHAKDREEAEEKVSRIPSYIILSDQEKEKIVEILGIPRDVEPAFEKFPSQVDEESVVVLDDGKKVVRKKRPIWLWLLVVLILVALCIFAIAWNTFGFLDRFTQVSRESDGAVATSTQTGEDSPIIADTINWDGKVDSLGAYIINGDPGIQGWETQGAQMTYVCTENYGVFISMDPGSVQGVSTGLGAACFIPCKKGNVVTLTTTHWSETGQHQQVHLFELIKPVPGVTTRDILLALKEQDGKPLGFYFADGTTYEKIQ